MSSPAGADEGAEAGDLRRPDTSLVIAATPRTGSWLLSAGLHETELVGQPEEYFRPDAQFVWSREWGIDRAAPYSTYIAHALDWSTSDNGVFAVKVHWYQFRWLIDTLRNLEESQSPEQLISERGAGADADMIARWLPRPCWVHMYRRDTAAQAVSYFKAGRTRVWFVVDGRQEANFEEPEEPIEPDFSRIRWLEDLVLQHDRNWRNFFEGADIEPLEIAYEDLVDDYAGTLGAVLEHVGVGSRADTEGYVPPLVKQGDATTEAWRERYLELRESLEPRPMVWK
ncbi:MAG TPA: Stf0 family sulfotransferase [Acidimicrobiales bacterium]|nr:Stf0 family sulfotransferase [Acidimicrobiales bacterium]